MTERELRDAGVETRHKAIIELARNEHAVMGEVEIDDTAPLSESDDSGENGCYVQAWVWVSFADTPYDKTKKEGDNQ